MTCPVCGNPDHAAIAVKDSHELHRCAQCTVIFVHPFPSAAELDEFYNEYHKTRQYRDKIGSKTRRARKRIASLHRRRRGDLLDVGCNLGFATEAGRSLGYRALGIDVDCDAIERARTHFPDAEFRCAGIAELAAEGRKFDVVYCSEVIEHLLDPLALLRDIRAVMKDDAQLYLTTPDVGHFSLPKDIDRLVAWNNFRPPEHLLYFNRKSLAHLFGKAGFGQVRFRFGFKPTMKVVARA